MKHIREYNLINEGIIIPFDMDRFIDKLVIENPETIEEANILAKKYNIKLVSYSEFIKSIEQDKEMLRDVPPENRYMFENSGFHFALLNKYTNCINMVVNYNLFRKFVPNIPTMFLNIFKSMMQHESIHLQQYNRAGNDPSKYDLEGSPFNNVDKYLGCKTEIMAYAFSIVDELRRNGKTKEEILDIINTNNGDRKNGSWIIGWYKENVKDPRVFKRIRKYAYLYLEELFKKERGKPNIHDKINMNQEMRTMKTFETYFASEPQVAPTTKPTTKPGTMPKKPSPIRRVRPSVDPKPKAEVEDLINKFNNNATKNDINEINDYYANKFK